MNPSPRRCFSCSAEERVDWGESFKACSVCGSPFCSVRCLIESRKSGRHSCRKQAGSTEEKEAFKPFTPKQRKALAHLKMIELLKHGAEQKAIREYLFSSLLMDALWGRQKPCECFTVTQLMYIELGTQDRCCYRPCSQPVPTPHYPLEVVNECKNVSRQFRRSGARQMHYIFPKFCNVGCAKKEMERAARANEAAVVALDHEHGKGTILFKEDFEKENVIDY